MIERKTYDEIVHIMDVGYQYAANLQAAGHFDHMEVGDGLVLDHLEEVEKPARQPTLSAGSADSVDGARGAGAALPRWAVQQ